MRYLHRHLSARRKYSTILLCKSTQQLGAPRPRTAWTNGNSTPIETRRSFGLEALPAALVPPVVFGGLLVTLWTYKCLMMIVFQNKIIYMPGVPPFSRSEKVEDYTALCKPVEWVEHELRSGDGTRIKLLEGTMTGKGLIAEPRLVVLYFQGNASSLPPRLPALSSIMKAVSGGDSLDIRFIALSYRGYWTSKGRPSQTGIELDAQAALNWVLNQYSSSQTKIIVWGQSIGAGVASLAVARLAQEEPQQLSRVSGLLLETPFIDLRAMLIALYPQKYLPYRYLAPFLMSTWDSKKALESLGDRQSPLRVGLLQAGTDEIVPDGQAMILRDVCRARGIDVDHQVVPGALHTEIMMKPQGRRLIVAFLRSHLRNDVQRRD